MRHFWFGIGRHVFANPQGPKQPPSIDQLSGTIEISITGEVIEFKGVVGLEIVAALACSLLGYSTQHEYFIYAVIRVFPSQQLRSV